MKTPIIILKNKYCFALLATIFSCLILSACGTPVGEANESGNDNSIINTGTNTITYTSASESVLSYQGSGGVEQTTLVFSVNNASEESVANVSVNFTIDGISATLENSSDVSDAGGLVQAVVSSGTIPGVFSVTATTGSSTATSADITITAGTPTQNRISVGMDRNIADAYNVVGTDNDINVIVSDKLGNPVLDGTQVRFIAPNCGVVTPSCSTTGGECAATWNSTDIKTSNLQCNILVYTTGQEDFNDVNGNGAFDSGIDDFVVADHDIGEPFIDLNNNSAYDRGENFVDFFVNNIYDTADGQWTESTAIYSVQPFVLSTGNLLANFSITPETDINAGAIITVEITDSFGNSPPGGTTIVVSGNGSVVNPNVSVPKSNLGAFFETYTINSDGSSNTDNLIIKIDPAGNDGSTLTYQWSLTD